MKTIAIISMLFFARIVSAQVVLNEVQISPIGGRFVELYNPDSIDVDMTGWYIQRKTATGSSFSSLVTSTQFSNKIIKANGYFVISRGQIANSDIVVDGLTLTESNTLRMRDSKGTDIDQVTWTTVADGKSYQRVSSSEWSVALPTPRTSNGTIASSPPPTPQDLNSPGKTGEVSAVSPLSNTSNFPVEPQIFTSAGAVNRTTLVGAPIIFSGKVFGLKKEPIENARMVWSFGDGARKEGQSVSHTYYYPGEYIVVLDAASGFYAASTRVRVVVDIPKLILQTGGDTNHSFISIENQADTEIDLSGWGITTQDKNFIFPDNTILGSRKVISFASEVTGLSVPLDTLATLHFPNGSPVPLLHESIVSPTVIPTIVEGSEKKMVSLPSLVIPRLSGAKASNQMATVLDANPEPRINTLSSPKDNHIGWLWYLMVGALGILAFLGFRLVRFVTKTIPADEFEITEEVNDEGDKEDPRQSEKLPF